jgi:4-amino-4-deoxy-L-arabinose transferase-like glycosyltransferase
MKSLMDKAPPDISQADDVIYSTWQTISSSPVWIALIAFFLRVAWIILGHTYRFKTTDNNFGFGWEMGRIAASLASGHGFSNQFGPPSGPTAWEPPLYPYLAAGVFFVFGIYSKLSAFVLLAINSAFSALTCIPIFLIARRMFSLKVALWSAWAWALLPNVMFWCTRAIWETSLSALLLALAIWLCVKMEELDGWRPWFGFGLLWGVIALNGTSLLAFLPAAGLWTWRRRWKVRKKSLAGVVLASAVFFAAIAPWLIRNYQTFGTFIFIRDNFGAELRLGNGPGADGMLMNYLDPLHDPQAMRQVLSMGEVAYIAMRKQQAVDYIKQDYGRFAKLSLKRFFYFWAGPPKENQDWWVTQSKNALFLLSSVLALWGLGHALRLRKHGAWLLFWLVLLYPAVYYFVYTIPRYRHPIEPEMTILCVFLITEAERKSAFSRQKSGVS